MKNITVNNYHKKRSNMQFSLNSNLIESFQDVFLSGLVREKDWAGMVRKPRFIINSSKIL